ncbi:aminomethyl-transferring glycine dehydrogenase subunit GcvPA [Massilibacterium senegalense]|uniref:aminomethyl-transferring glycine dehydrogenase subunit GcvPA n=1 Tax=Massilibacterium senegalense TaxID=1632858 RepID=UPI000780E85F|nr:aminomethyl-transferring glycine dehydrogenase subunit GcvPA [Massilibacterium senegalense]
MKFRYLPMTEQDETEMLATIGVSNIEDLFSDIPENVRLNRSLSIQEAQAESDVMKQLQHLSDKNCHTKEYPSFLGAGVYDHTIPAVVEAVISRSEFYTAYTPYQPEISQGELQAIFEFQTMICELTGMDVANSSMYDGSTALSEAAFLAVGNSKKKQTILVSKGVHPEYRETLKTYASGAKITIVELELKEGQTDLEDLKRKMTEDIAGVIIQYPNFYGQIEPLQAMEPIVHAKKSHFIVSSNPLSLALLTPPGNFGADIVIGDAQVFGISQSLGGPHCGYFAVTKKLMRKIPGRLVGQTIDEQGRRGFVLTLQAREQHIRRDKATSNICSNQALNALAASVAMTAFGKQGIRELAKQNIQKAHYAKQRIERCGGTVLFGDAFFNEFVIPLNKPIEAVNKKLMEKGIIGGLDLGKYANNLKNSMLVCVTELRMKEEIDLLAKELEGYYA